MGTSDVILSILQQEKELMGKLYQDYSQLMKDAENALNQQFWGLKQFDIKSIDFLRLKLIGLPEAYSKGDSDKGDKFAEDSIRKLTYLLNSLGHPWCIRLRSIKGICSIEFGIDRSFSKEFPDLFRSCIARAEFEEIHIEDSNDNPNCKGTISYVRIKGESEKEQEKICSSFITALGQAALSFDYSVLLTFSPVKSQAVKDRHERILDIRNALSYFAKLNLQKSTQSSSGSNTGEGLGFVGNINKGSSKNDSETFGLSNEREISQVKSIIEALDYESHKLRSAEVEGAWLAAFSIFAEGKERSAIVSSVICSAIAGQNKTVSWSFDKNNNHDEKSNYWYKTSELAELAAIPTVELPGYSITVLEDFALTAPPMDKASASIELGDFLWNGTNTNQKLSLGINQLNRHAFICGMTGAGKTNTVFHLLKHINVPFFVFEPVKTEYEVLEAYFPEIKIWNMEGVSDNALMLNPFWFPKGGSLQYHMDSIKAVIASAFSLYAAMPNILEQCINRIYVSRGWSIENGLNLYEGELPEDMLYPTMGDLCNEVERYLNSSQYDSETMAAYKGALLTRLNTFTSGVKGTLLNTAKHPDFDKWSKCPQIVVLDALSDDGDKAIVMGSLLIQYFQYVKKAALRSKLEHIIVIEEAHRLFKNVDTKTSNAEVADPCGKLVDILTNMLAEIRAYGEGIIIADQSPTKIAQGVIKNSNIKIVHRLDALDDAQIVANALAMKSSEQSFSLLAQGEAIVRLEKMSKPAKIKVPYVKQEKSGAYADKKMNSSHDINLLRRSSIADVIWQNTFIKDKIRELMGKAVNHILLDDMQNIIGVINSAYTGIMSIIASYGYGENDIELSENDYINLMKYGYELYLRSDPVYCNHYKFIQLANLFFNRLIEFLSFTDSAAEKELEFFSLFRHVKLYPVLLSIISNTSCNRKEFDGIISCVGGSNNVKLLFELIQVLDEDKIYEQNSIEGVQTVLEAVLSRFFLVYPSQMLIKQLVAQVTSLYQALKLVKKDILNMP